MPKNIDFMYLKPGEYKFPFNFLLPYKLPTSFEHSNGRIRYALKCTLDMHRSLNKHSIKLFTVCNDIDLVEKSPSERTEVGLKSGSINIFLSANKPGYVPGETLYCLVRIENKSNKLINMTITLRLVQEILLTGYSRCDSFIKKHRTIKYKRDVTLVKLDKTIRGNSNETIVDNQEIFIPSICNSSWINDLCKIIEINYYVALTTTSIVMENKYLLKLPIKIGTLPLYSHNNKQVPSYKESCFEASNFQPYRNLIDFGSASLFGGDIIESDEDTFRPLYPVF